MLQKNGSFLLWSALLFSAFAGLPTAPADVPVWNPAFDVTPHSLLTGIITERGVLRPPFEPELARLLQTT